MPVENFSKINLKSPVFLNSVFVFSNVFILCLNNFALFALDKVSLVSIKHRTAVFQKQTTKSISEEDLKMDRAPQVYKNTAFSQCVGEFRGTAGI